MPDKLISTAADLFEPKIRHNAPIYGMKIPLALLERLDARLTPGGSRKLRFPPSCERKLLDKEADAWWEPFSLGKNADHWFYGQVTMNPAFVGDYFRNWTIRDEAEEMFPDMFVWGNLVVSERVRDLIATLAPGFCYFAPADIRGKDSGKLLNTPYFNRYIRRTLYYKGPLPKIYIRPEGQGAELVGGSTWTAFCNTEVAQNVAFNLPIFLFDRSRRYPMFSADLFKLLKREKVTGLLEMTYWSYTHQTRPDEFAGFETVFPHDPAYRSQK